MTPGQVTDTSSAPGGLRALLWILAACTAELLIVAGIYGLASSARPPAWLHTVDELVADGQPCQVAVAIEQDLPPLLLGSLSGVEVTLTVEDRDGNVVHQATATTTAGHATFAVPALDKPGMYSVRVATSPTAHLESLSTEATLAVIGKDEPIAIVAVQDALWTPSSEPATRSVVVRHDAVETLEELARPFTVVYALLQPHERIESIKERMARLGFPPGPLLDITPAAGVLWRVYESNLRRTLEPWLKAKQIRWAFAAHDSEAQAFAALGVETVHLFTTVSRTRSPRLQVAIDWKAARDMVLGSTQTERSPRSP